MFTVITLNYFSDRLLIFSVSISCRFLSGSFVCNVFLCCFILADLLYLWSPFYRLPANAGDTGDMGSIPGLGRSPGEGNGNPLQYSCLENPMDGGAWATVYGIAKSQTWLSDFAFTFTFYRLQDHSSSCFWYLPLVCQFGPETFAVTHSIGGLIGAVLLRVCSRYWAGLPFCSVVITAFSGIGVLPVCWSRGLLISFLAEILIYAVR